jgi:hypothetical protein
LQFEDLQNEKTNIETLGDEMFSALHYNLKPYPIDTKKGTNNL